MPNNPSVNGIDAHCLLFFFYSTLFVIGTIFTASKKNTANICIHIVWVEFAAFEKTYYYNIRKYKQATIYHIMTWELINYLQPLLL